MDELLKRGLDGGREAAQMLNESIMGHIDREDRSGRRVQVWTYVFFNLKGLQQTLVGCDVCTLQEFEAFMMGFNQANPRFTINDVYSGKEAADAKIKGDISAQLHSDLAIYFFSFSAYLQTWTRFPQTLRVYFGGASASSAENAVLCPF